MTFEVTESEITRTCPKRQVNIQYVINLFLLQLLNRPLTYHAFYMSCNVFHLAVSFPDHSRILLPFDELDRKTTHSYTRTFTKWQQEGNISDVIH